MSTGPSFNCLGAIILAAGLSRRMGQEDKLLKPLAGQPLIRHAVAPLLTLGLAQMLVVGGSQAGALRELFPDDLELCVNPEPESGMGTSLALGARLLAPTLNGVFIVLGDMPFIASEDFARLATAFERLGEPNAICVPFHDGQRGHPVLFGRAHFPALRQLGGDEGARSVVRSDAASVTEVRGCSPGVLVDLDSPEAFRDAEARLSAEL